MNTEHAINSAELTTTVPRKTSKWPIVAVFILIIGFLAYVNLVQDESRVPTTLTEQCIFNAGVNLNGVSIPENRIRVSPSLNVEKLYVCFDSMRLQTTPHPDEVRVLDGVELESSLAKLSEPDEVEGGNCLTSRPTQQIVVAELADGSFVQIKQPTNRCVVPIFI